MFQRDEDRSLQGNLGFGGEQLFSAKSLTCGASRAGWSRRSGGAATGDQRIVNRALAEPSSYGNPRLRWTLFPPNWRRTFLWIP